MPMNGPVRQKDGGNREQKNSEKTREGMCMKEEPIVKSLRFQSRR